MDGIVHQLVPMSCNFCGQACVQPRLTQYTDRLSQEMIVEAIWCCSRCGNKFNSGIVSREKIK